MEYSRSQKAERAIFAVREVVHDLPVYQTRGMASAVDVGGKQCLLTWKGVFNEDDRALTNHKPVKFHRSSRCKEKNHQLGKSKIGQAGSFSFIPVEGLKSCNALTLIDPGSALTENDVCAKSFIGGKKFLKFKFEYNQEKKRHKLKGKKCTIEKSAVLGSPIIKDKRVIGVVGEDADGQLIPCFITQTELDHIKENSSESGNCKDLDTKDSAALVPQSDQPPNGTIQEECQEFRDEQPKLVSGLDKPSSSTETVPALESEEKIILKYLPYLALDMQEDKASEMFWRSLGLTDGDINGIKKDNDEDYERCYKVLKTWWQRDGTYVNLAKALKKHEYTATFEKYCLKKHDPPTGKTEELPKNLKQGCVSEGDLQNISFKVQRKRKRVGRALGLDDDNLDVIEEEYRDNISEQSYQILLKWKRKRGTEATYHALARALCDRTVMMKHVLNGY